MLAEQGAPHGTLVTATEQTAGRGRQGRAWAGPAGGALLLSLVVREQDALLPLRAGLAVADVAGPRAQVKWPNDVLVERRKVAGILVEGRPQEGWAVLGIGVNVAVDLAELPPELHATAGTLGRRREEVEPFLGELLAALDARLREPARGTVEALRQRDALLDRPIHWSDRTGTAKGIDDQGRLLVATDSELLALESGEVHLG
jgi:BirA family biotin operon repressor/biotin-[acetyl-CoA-carboxylase] ligase